MNKKILITACLGVFTASAEPVTLSGDNFSAMVVDRENGMPVSDKPWFIKFYAPWCGHCKTLAPTWAAFAKKHEDLNDLNVGKIDCTEETNRPICSDYEIKGYPSLLLILPFDAEK